MPTIQSTMSKPSKQTKNGDRESRFLEYFGAGLPIQDAGRKAGYSESYVTSGLYQKLQNPAFQDKLAAFVDSFPEYRRNLAKLRLTQASRIEQKIYDKALNDTEFATRPVVSKTMEREYRLTGLLQDDHAKPVMVQINLAMIQSSQESDLDVVKVKQIEHDNEDDTK